MFRRYVLTMALLVLSLCGLNAQQVLKLGSGNLTLEDNVGVRGRALPEAAANHAQLMVLRFDNLPTAKQKAELRRQGIELHSYISHNLYYATVKGNPAEVLPATRTRGAMPGVRQANVVDPAWKVSPEVSSGRIPQWAQGSRASEARMVVMLFKGADVAAFAQQLTAKGYRVLSQSADFGSVVVEMPVAAAHGVAANDCVSNIGYVEPQAELLNAEARTMARVNVLAQSPLLGGYGLTGKGQDVGIWDGSIEPHPDLGSRLVSHEFEYISDHGQHTSGTLAGAGLLDPRAMGMAPEATVHAWNFNRQSNGLDVEQEILLSAERYNVKVSSHSYGVYISNNSGKEDRFCVNQYQYVGSDANLDKLTNELYPDALALFSGGNDQANCLNFTKTRYRTSTKRAKNCILVGALEEDGSMSNYSSWGPMPDGRMIPHICISGSNTFSTVYGMEYEGGWQGTSMACPAAAGTMTLLHQLYQQIHGEKPIAALAKAIMLNSGHDRGNVGPDYQFGYGVMDGLRAARVIEKQQHFVDDVDHGGSKQFKINVPAATSELRVMLVWSDVPAQSGTWGEIVNDLDLTVRNNGIAYVPWILDPSKPEQPATKGRDHINNQELVTITNPAAGEYIIDVKGYAIPMGPQQFAIAYDFIREGVELTYPMGGETFAPKQQVLARWITAGKTEPISIEISLDGGETFSTLLSNVPATQTEARLTMPDVSTDKAMLRIRQGNSSDLCKTTFALLGVPSGLKVSTAAPCDVNSYKLCWNKVAGAAQYAVFKADKGNDFYEELGRTNDTAYALPALSVERNIYTVRAVSANGSLSERAVAVMTSPSHAASLTALPFEENFENFLSPYVAYDLGADVSKRYIQTIFDMPYNQQLVVFSGIKGNNAWNTTGTDLFADNASKVARAMMCNIDASTVEAPLWLTMNAIIENSGNNNAAFRVVVNGTDVIADVLGRSMVQQNAEDSICHYDLSAYVGTTFSVSIEAVLRSEDDAMTFGHLKFWRPASDIELVGVAVSNAPKLTANPETVTVTLANHGFRPMYNVAVTYTVGDGKTVAEMIYGPIEPFSTYTYTFEQKMVLEQADVLTDVRAEVIYAQDDDQSNNVAVAGVYRTGTDYTLMACGTTNLKLNASTTPQIITDNGGKLGEYSNECASALTIYASAPGKRVQIRLLKGHLEDDYDYLHIYDGADDASAELAALTGVLDDITIISSDTALHLRFVADKYTVDEGFIIEYVEVEDGASVDANTFTLASVENVSGDYISGDGQPVVVKLRNNSTEAQSNVVVRYSVNKGDWVTDTLTTLYVGDSLYTFKKKLKLNGELQEVQLRAEILNEDALMSDNAKTHRFYSDVLCLPITGTSSTNYIRSVTFGSTTATTEALSLQPLNMRSFMFVGYKDYDANKLIVSLPRALTSGSVGVWVDWNDDLQFDDAEGQVVAAAAGLTNYEFDLNLSDKAVGEHHMRVRAGSFDVTPCDDASDKVGQAADYTFNLLAQNPDAAFYNLAVVSVKVPSAPVNLTNAETVEVELINSSPLNSISGFSLELIVDGKSVATEAYAGTVASGETVKYEFVAKANLANAGVHTVEVRIHYDNDSDDGDNAMSISLFNEKPSMLAGNWALNFDGKDDALFAGTLGGVNLESFTYEAWINPNSCGGYGDGAPGFGRVFAGKSMMLFANGLASSQYYPMNSFVISIDNGGSYRTDAETFKIGKWQHVAVTHDNATHVVKFYINGKEATLTERTPITGIQKNDTADLYIGNQSDLARQFDGLIDNARVWSVVRTKDQIAASMAANGTLNGASGLVAEYLFNEGPYTVTTANTAGGAGATIVNANVEEGKNSIWQNYRALRTIEVDGQLNSWVEVAPDHYRAELAMGADKSALATKFITYFDTTVVKINGIEVQSGDAIDFSSPVEVTATAKHQGRVISNTCVFEVNVANALQSFGIAAAGLNYTAPVPTLIEANVPGAINALATTFDANGATVLFNGEAKASGDEVDYTIPVTVAVVGASGQVIEIYTVILRQAQTISWGSVAQTYTYGDAAFALEATSSVGAVVAFESSNPEVIVIDGASARIVGAGKATITAKQLGGLNLQPAEAASTISITVNKAPLTITADDQTIDLSDPMPEFTMSLEGLVNADTEASLAELPTIATTATDDSPAGVYEITLKGGSDANYAYELVSGKLTINDVPVYTLTFGVMGAGQPLADATIEVAGRVLTTNEQGVASLTIKGGSYAYSVSKAGYDTYAATIDLNANAGLQLSLFALPTYTISYATDGNGIIVGKAEQQVEMGRATETVVALANGGYDFVQWNDGVLTPERQEYNVTASASYTAQFAIKTFTLNYAAGEHGKVEGELSQTLEFGSMAMPIVAIADEGYKFVQWSDGVTDNPRQDVAERTVNATAIFDVDCQYPLSTLSWQYSFEQGLPVCWEAKSSRAPNYQWVFTGNRAAYEMKGYGVAHAEITTPLFDLTGMPDGSTASLSFQSEYKKPYNKSYEVTVSIEYSADGGDTWMSLKNWGTDEEKGLVEVEVPAPMTSTMRFRWVYDGPVSNRAAAFWYISDIKLVGVPKMDSYTVTYSAAMGGSIEGANAEGVFTADVAAGTNGPSVNAIPDLNYVFDRWSDGSTQNPRTDLVGKSFEVTAFFIWDCNVQPSLPWRYSFETDGYGNIPEIGCWQTTTTKENANWDFSEKNAYYGWYYTSGAPRGELATPVFDLSSESEVTLSFSKYFSAYKGDYGASTSASVEYSLDGGATWNELEKWSRVAGNDEYVDKEPETYTLTTLSDNMRFRWVYDGAEEGKSVGEINIYNIELYGSSFGVIEYTSNDNGQYYLGQIDHNGQLSAKYRTIEPIGTNVNVSAISRVGYHFAKWSDGNKNPQRTDVVTATPQSFVAEFVIDTFMLTYNAGSNGVVSMNDVDALSHSQEVTYKGAGVEITAKPDNGYKFVRWNDGRTDNPRVDTDVRKDSVVVAEFALRETYAIAATATPADYGDVEGAGTYTEGDQVTLTATAKDGSAFVRWISNGVAVSTANPFTFVATGDSTLVAEFEVATFTVAYSAPRGGYIEGEARQIVTYGKDATPVEAKIVDGYGLHFVQWSDGLTTASRTEQNVTANMSLVAEFALNTYTLTYTAGANGSLQGEATQTVVHGGAATTVEAIPANGYEFVGWSDGSLVNPRTDINVQGAFEVMAEFKKIQTGNTEETGVFEVEYESLTVYPNPTAGAVQVVVPSTASGISEVMVYNANGNLVQQVSANGNVLIDLSNYPAGMYIIRVGKCAAKVMKL